VLECLDDAAQRRWCEAGLAALRRHQREIDEVNVYPVPDGDTGLVQRMAAVGLPAVGRRRRRRARAIVAERQAWIAASVSKWDAAAYLGRRRDEFTRVAKQRGRGAAGA